MHKFGVELFSSLSYREQQRRWWSGGGFSSNRLTNHACAWAQKLWRQKRKIWKRLTPNRTRFISLFLWIMEERAHEEWIRWRRRRRRRQISKIKIERTLKNDTRKLNLMLIMKLEAPLPSPSLRACFAISCEKVSSEQKMCEMCDSYQSHPQTHSVP